MQLAAAAALLVLLAGHARPASAGDTALTAPDAHAGPTMATYRYFYGARLGASANLTAEAVLASNSELCGGGLVAGVDGRIVVADSGECDPSVKARAVARSGGLAIVSNVGAATPGFYAYWFHDPSASGLPLHCFSTVDAESGAFLSQMRRARDEGGAPVTVRLVESVNPWQDVVESGWWILFQVLMSIGACFNIGMDAVKARQIGSSRGWKLSIPLFCLGLCGLSNLILLAVVAIDPMGSRLIFSKPANFVLFSVTQPLNLICTVVLGFFFHNLTQGTRISTNGSFLGSTRARVIAGCTSAGLLFFDLSASLLRAENDAKYANLYLINVVFMMLINLVIAALFVRSTWRVRQFLLSQGAKTNGAKTRSSVNSLTRNVFLAASFMISENFFRLMGALAYRDASVWFAFIWLGTTSSLGRTLFTALAFSTRSKKKTAKPGTLSCTETSGGASAAAAAGAKRSPRRAGAGSASASPRSPAGARRPAARAAGAKRLSVVTANKRPDESRSKSASVTGVELTSVAVRAVAAPASPQTPASPGANEGTGLLAGAGASSVPSSPVAPSSPAPDVAAAARRRSLEAAARASSRARAQGFQHQLSSVLQQRGAQQAGEQDEEVVPPNQVP